MKKAMKMIFPAAVLAIMFSACNFNEQNFPGYDAGVAPTNKFAYTDSITDADMVAISKLGLVLDTTYADSLKTKALGGVNKYFNDVETPASRYIPLWLASKYKYGDPKSSVIVISPQYISSEGELQYVSEKYILDSSKVFNIYRNEIFSEAFTSNLGSFSAISKIGDDQKWIWKIYGGLGYAYANGFKVSPQDNEDWLISPAIDLSKRIDANLTFDNAINYDPGFYSKATLWVNDTWDGTTLDTLQWVRKEFTGGTGISWTFANSGPVSLLEYAGKSNVRIAFRYESKLSDAKCPGWEVANIKILESLEE